MLFGTQRLIDDSQVLQSYVISASEPITQVNVLVNPRLVLKQSAEERRTAFVELLNQYLDAITAGTHVEGPDFIANTRAVFNLTMRIARITALSGIPGGGATVSGMIFSDANENGARDDGEAQIAGATMTLTPAIGSAGTLSAETASAAQARTTTTGEDGVYTFTGVPNGTYTLQARLPNGQRSAPITITVDGIGPVSVPAMPVQVGSDLYLPSTQRS
jgi:hypothetical protein